MNTKSVQTFPGLHYLYKPPSPRLLLHQSSGVPRRMTSQILALQFNNMDIYISSGNCRQNFLQENRRVVISYRWPSRIMESHDKYIYIFLMTLLIFVRNFEVLIKKSIEKQIRKLEGANYIWYVFHVLCYLCLILTLLFFWVRRNRCY